MSAAPTMAFVEVGMIDMLMPLPKALQLVALLEHATMCERDFARDTNSLRETFTPLERAEVRVMTIKASQIKTTMPSTKPATKRTAAKELPNA